MDAAAIIFNQTHVVVSVGPTVLQNRPDQINILFYGPDGTKRDIIRMFVGSFK